MCSSIYFNLGDMLSDVLYSSLDLFFCRLRGMGQKVREYIRAQVGKHFDPKVAEAFFQLLGPSGG